MLGGLKSRKLVIGILSAIGVIVNDYFGKPVSSEAIYSALGILGTYVLAQGWADSGKQGAAKAAERAVAQGGVRGTAVLNALSAIPSGKMTHDDEDDGPTWDGPKGLME